MPPALIGETELKVVQIPVLVDGKFRDIEQGRKPLDLIFRDRMLHDHYGIVDIASLDQIILEKVFDLMENTKVLHGASSVA